MGGATRNYSVSRVTQFLHLNKPKVERRLLVENELSEIQRSSEPQHPREAHSSKHVLLVNFEN
jgi:hypothetical protein